MTLHVALAFDKASVRSFDKDGRMRVEVSHITREQVADYLGREIPGWDRLGLNPNKVYSLYRPAEEIRKALATFNQIPILLEHVHVTAANSRPDLVVGATGTDAEWDDPYLDNSLVFWTGDAIDLIESDEAKELSCSYHYTPVIRSGKFNGQPYDIVMTDLIANHVALVAAGRAGPTVVVGDHLPKELLHMKKLAPPSRMALIARGALLALSPRLAADSKLDVSSLTNGLNASNWIDRKAAILETVKPLLASDADVGTLHKLLDGLDSDAKPGALGTDDDAPPAAGGDPGALDPGQTDQTLDAVDADPCAELMAMLQGKLSPEELQAFEARLRSAITPAAALDEEGPPATPGTPPNPAKKDDVMISQPAMDAALAKTKAESIAEGRKLAREITEAEKIASAYVGVLPAMDSAEEVYKSALELLGVKTDGVHPSAYRAVLEAQSKPGTEQATGARIAVAMDAQTAVKAQFPNAGRVRIID